MDFGAVLGVIVTAAVGIICIALGIINSKGDVSSLHSYHRSRVKEEDILPFGRTVGLGMIIIGASIVVYSLLLLVTELCGIITFATVGIIIMAAGIIAGSIIMFYAMKKYNGGIF